MTPVYGHPDMQSENQKMIINLLAQNNCLLQQLGGIIKQCTTSNLSCLLEQVICNQNSMISILYNIQMSLNTDLPTVVQCEFPEITEQGIIYHYSGILREIVGNIVVIFRGTLNQRLPVYLADATGYGHIVTAIGSDNQLIGNAVEINKMIPAIYEGNYIHLQ